MVEESLNEPAVLGGGSEDGGPREEETEIMMPAKRAKIAKETSETARREKKF